jgi:nucleoside-diphosphate-sugar epimerase
MRNNLPAALNKKKILVTGATGFIGGHLVLHLLEIGCQIRLLVRSNPSIQFLSDERIEVSIGDLKDQKSLITACEGIDMIIHLAGLAHTTNVNDFLTKTINVNGTRSLLSAAIKNKVKRFVLISSSLASCKNVNQNNDKSYARSKLEAEKIVLSAHNTGAIDGVILRPVNVYGEGMRGNIASLISFIRRGILIPLPHLDTRISLIGVDDLSRAIVLAIHSEKAPGNMYYLTDGEEYLINDIEQEIYRVCGRKLPSWRTPRLLLYIGISVVGAIGKLLGALNIRIPVFSNINSRTYDNLFDGNLYDNSQACNELGFKPTSTFFDWLTNFSNKDNL